MYACAMHRKTYGQTIGLIWNIRYLSSHPTKSMDIRHHWQQDGCCIHDAVLRRLSLALKLRIYWVSGLVCLSCTGTRRFRSETGRGVWWNVIYIWVYAVGSWIGRYNLWNVGRVSWIYHALVVTIHLFVFVWVCLISCRCYALSLYVFSKVWDESLFR